MTGRVSERPRHSPAECARLLARLLAAPDALLGALAPEGWQRSPLRRVFRPTREQRAEERARLRRNLAKLRQGEGEADPDSAPVEPESPPLAPEAPSPDPGARSADVVEREWRVVELLGRALWDVFSDNHTVVDGDGTAYDLGSFRRSADFIAESINRRYVRLPFSYGYLDFYMGTAMISGRADFGPVYRWIFSRLQAEGCRWTYSFPRIHLVQPYGPEEEPTDYDPTTAVRLETERESRAEELWELRELLERIYREALRQARRKPLPETVAAYRDVFGALPEGWPHPDM